MRMLSLSILTSSILLMPFSASILCGARFGKRVGQDSWLVPPTAIRCSDIAMVADFEPADPPPSQQEDHSSQVLWSFSSESWKEWNEKEQLAHNHSIMES